MDVIVRRCLYRPTSYRCTDIDLLLKTMTTSMPWDRNFQLLRSTSEDLTYSIVTIVNNMVLYSWSFLRVDLKYSHHKEKRKRNQLCEVTDVGTLTLDFPTPRPVKNQFLLFMSYSVCGILLQRPEQTKHSSFPFLIFFHYLIVTMGIAINSMNL